MVDLITLCEHDGELIRILDGIFGEICDYSACERALDVRVPSVNFPFETFPKGDELLSLN